MDMLQIMSADSLCFLSMTVNTQLSSRAYSHMQTEIWPMQAYLSGKC